MYPPNLPPNTKLASQYLKHNSQHQENLVKAGWLGKFFGMNDRISLYIAGVTIFLMLISGIIFTFFSFFYSESFDNTIKLWGVITPIITLSLGYIFGKGSKSKEKIPINT